MPNQFGNYDGQAYVPSGESAAQQPSGMERLAGMANLLPNDLLGMLARLLQKPVDSRPYSNTGGELGSIGEWRTMTPMPPPPRPVFEGINGALPMRPTEPPRNTPMYIPSFVRG